MKKNPPTYTIQSHDGYLSFDHPYEYIMIFDDFGYDHGDFATWTVQIRKLVIRSDGWRDTELVTEKRFSENRGSRKHLLIRVLTKCTGDDDFLISLANDLWYSHEVGLDIPPGLYAEYFPDSYKGMIDSLLWHRNQKAKEVMES